MNSRLDNQAREGNTAAFYTGYFLKGIKYFLAGIKAVTSAAQTFFGTQYSVSYTSKSKNIYSKNTIVISALTAANSLLLISGTRSREMVLSSEPKQLARSSLQSEVIVETALDEKSCHCQLPPELVHVNVINKAIYSLIIFLSKGSRIFSSLAAYNGAINFCETIVALVSLSDDPLENINRDPAKQSLIQLFGLICFSAQMLSFSMFQSTTVKDYLLTWWLSPEKRNQEIYSQGYLNILLAITFFITITSTTFFGIFSTEAGLNNLNEYLFKSILKFEMPQFIIDSMVGISAISMASLTTTNVIPSTYHFLTNKNAGGRKKSLTTTGKLLMASGLIDCLASSYSTTYSSIIKMSQLFNIDEYNFFLRISTILSIGSTSFFYYFVYNTRVGLERFYSVKNDLGNLNENLISNEEKIIGENDQEQLENNDHKPLGSDDNKPFEDDDKLLEDDHKPLDRVDNNKSLEDNDKLFENYIKIASPFRRGGPTLYSSRDPALILVIEETNSQLIGNNLEGADDACDDDTVSSPETYISKPKPQYLNFKI
jgi:hypothetical protein